MHPAAEAELREATAYYEGKVAGLGADFRAEVELACAQIQSAPERWPKRIRRTRWYRVRRFPYSIIYLDLELSILVVAVAHAKRRPHYWRIRP